MKDLHELQAIRTQHELKSSEEIMSLCKLVLTATKDPELYKQITESVIQYGFHQYNAGIAHGAIGHSLGLDFVSPLPTGDKDHDEQKP